MSAWEVRCQDGKVRHDAPFDHRWEAERWAWWGHICFATHTVTKVTEPKEATA